MPLSADTYTGMDVLVRGIELGCVKLPIHSVYLKTDLVIGMVNVGVCEKLPVDDVDVILGNDLAGGKVFPSTIVTTIPVCDSKISLQYLNVFPVCAVTRSQTRENEDQVDLSDSFLVRSSPTEFALSVDSAVKLDKDAGAEVPIVRLGRAELAAAQKTDSSLAIWVDVAVSDKSKLDGAFHPQSQGALERFHQMLKTMLKTHCLDSGRDWAESLPLLMFAIRESVQNSLGFSPAELVFGHVVRGPLKLLSEQLLATKPMAKSVSKYVDTFRKRFKHVRNLARANLTSAQAVMKAQYDQ